MTTAEEFTADTEWTFELQARGCFDSTDDGAFVCAAGDRDGGAGPRHTGAMTCACLTYSRAALLLVLPFMLVIGCTGDKGATEGSTSDASDTTDATSMVATTGGTEATSPTTSAGTTAGETGGTTSGVDACEPLPAATSDCCCFTLDEDDASLRNDCPEVELCGKPSFDCSIFDPDCPVTEGDDGPVEFTVDDMAAVTCVLEALRDGTPGQVSWYFGSAETDGQHSKGVRYWIQQDRRVFVVRDDRYDLSYTVEETREETLKDAAYFTDCLAGPDVRTIALCLHATTSGEVLQVCEPGGSFSEEI